VPGNSLKAVATDFAWRLCARFGLGREAAIPPAARCAARILARLAFPAAFAVGDFAPGKGGAGGGAVFPPTWVRVVGFTGAFPPVVVVVVVVVDGGLLAMAAAS